MEKDICRKTRNAIEDIFFAVEIGTHEDALRLLGEENPALVKHLERCRNCIQTLDAHLNCEAVYAESVPA